MSSDQGNNVRLAPKMKHDETPNLPTEIIESQDFQDTTLPTDTQLKRSALLAMKQKGIKNFNKSGTTANGTTTSTAVDFGDFASDDENEDQHQNSMIDDDDDFIDIGDDLSGVFASILFDLAQVSRSSTRPRFHYEMDDGSKKASQNLWNSTDEVDPYYVRDVNGETALKSASIFTDFKNFESASASATTSPNSPQSRPVSTALDSKFSQETLQNQDDEEGNDMDDMPELLDLLGHSASFSTTSQDTSQDSRDHIVDQDTTSIDDSAIDSDDDDDMPALDAATIESEFTENNPNSLVGKKIIDWLVDIAVPNPEEQTTTQLHQAARQEQLHKLIDIQNQLDIDYDVAEEKRLLLQEGFILPEQNASSQDEDQNKDDECQFIAGQSYTKPTWDPTTQSNKFDFRHNMLPQGCSVFGPARFERESDQSTSLVLEPGSYIRLTPNFSGRNVKRGFYVLSMEIYFDQLPENTISFSSTDISRSGCAEAIMTRDGNVGYHGGDLSSTRLRAHKWERLSLSVDPNIKMRYDSAFIATINGKLALVSKDPNGLLNEKGLLRDRLFIFGSSKPSFMDRVVRVKSITLQPRAFTQHDISTPDSSAIYSPYQAQLVSNNVKLYQHMSLSSFFNKAPPVWQQPLFSNLLTDTCSVDDQYAHSIPHTSFYLWSHLLAQTAEAQTELFPTVLHPTTVLPNNPATPQQTLYHQNIGHITQLVTSVSSMFLDCAMFMKIHPLTSSAPTCSLYVKKITERIKALAVGESTIIPFLVRHTMSLPKSLIDSTTQTAFTVQTPILFVVESITASVARLTLINPFLNDGIKYHDITAAGTQHGSAFNYRPTISAEVSLQHLSNQTPWWVVTEAIFNAKDGAFMKIDKIYFTFLPLLFGQSYESLLADAQQRQIEYTKYQLTKSLRNAEISIDSKDHDHALALNKRYADLEYAPVTGAGSSNQLLLYTTEFIFRRAGFSPLQAKMMTLCLKLRALDMVYNDLSYVSVLNPSEVYAISNALRHVASFTTSCLQIQTNQAIANSAQTIAQHNNADKLHHNEHTLVEAGNQINHNLLPLTTRQLFMIYRGLNRIKRELKTQKITSFSNQNQPTLLLDDGGRTKSSQYSLFPNADRFVLEDLHEKALNSEPNETLSFDLLSLPQGIRSYGDLVYILRRLVDLCITLRTQRPLIKNAQLLARSFIIYIFTELIPVPVSPHASDYDKSQSMYFSPATNSQIVDIFGLLFCLMKISMVLFLNGCQTPTDVHSRKSGGSHHDQYMSHFLGLSTESWRDQSTVYLHNGYEMQLIIGVQFAILDFITHKAPSDIRSPFSEIMRLGRYGLSITDWIVVTRGLIFVSPQNAIVRSKVIEYFERNKPHIKPYLTLETDGSAVGPEYEAIYNALRLAAGLQPSECTELGSIFDFDRDIVYFQYPFMRSLICTVLMFRTLCLRPQAWNSSILDEASQQGETIHNLNLNNYLNLSFYRGQFNMYLHPISLPTFSKSNRPQYASYSDPEFVVNDYLYGVHKKTTGNTTPFVPTVIKSEDDILHLKTLPTFDNTLSQQDSELLLSYLTTPYLKIPLLLNFFATNDRCHALKNPTLRKILYNSLFEQGQLIYQYNNNVSMDGLEKSAAENGMTIDAETTALLASPLANNMNFDEIIPTQVPAEHKSMIGTHYGYLFNELIHNPELLVTNLKVILESSFELDIGTIHSQGSVIILYVVRLIAFIHTYVRWILDLNENKNVLYPNFSSLHGLIITIEQKKRLREQEKSLHDLSQIVLDRLTLWATQLFTEVHLELAAKQYAHQAAEKFINEARGVLTRASDDIAADDFDEEADTGANVQKKIERILKVASTGTSNRSDGKDSTISLPNLKSKTKRLQPFASGLDIELTARLEKSGVIETRRDHWSARPAVPGEGLLEFNRARQYYEFEDNRVRAVNKSTRKRAVVKSLNENTLANTDADSKDGLDETNADGTTKDTQDELVDEEDGNDIAGLKFDGEFITATLQLSCTVHSHILLILRNCDISDNLLACRLIGSIMYLTTYYNVCYESVIKHEELFRVVHESRRTLITIINKLPQQPLNAFMDQIIRIATGLSPLDANVLVTYLQQDSNYIPPPQSDSTAKNTINPAFLPLEHPLYTQVLKILEDEHALKEALTQPDPFLNDTLETIQLDEVKTVKQWGLVPGTRGRWVSLKDTIELPYEEYKKYYFSTPGDVYEQSLDCEVNIQSLSISVRGSTMQSLPSQIQSSDSWRTVYGKRMQAALVENTSKYQMYRIVGSSIDVIRYVEQQRAVVPHLGSRQYIPSDLPKHEKWVTGVFEPCRLEYLSDPWNPLTFFLEDTPSSKTADTITIQACTPRRLEPVLEIKVFRTRKMVHVYKYVLYHGKIYTELMYTTNYYHCFKASCEYDIPVRPRETMYSPWNRHETIFQDVPRNLDSISVVIKRAKSAPENFSGENELYMPSRLLSGIVPSALLHSYIFWQDQKGNLRGYPRETPHDASPLDFNDFIIFCELITLDRVDSTGKKGSCFHITKVPTDIMKQRLRNSILLQSGLRLPSLSSMSSMAPSLTMQSSLLNQSLVTTASEAPPIKTDIIGEYNGLIIPEGMTYSLDQLQIIPPTLHTNSSTATTASGISNDTDKSSEIKKRAGISSGKKFKQNKNATLDGSDAVCELVNFLHAPKGSASYQIASVLTRLELVANMLPWIPINPQNENTTRSLNGAHIIGHHSDISGLDISNYQSNTQIAFATTYGDEDNKGTVVDILFDSASKRREISQRVLPYFIEIPSLQLSFESKFNSHDEIQLYSVDHNELYVSNTRTPQLSTLTRALPHGLILQSLHNDLQILVPAFDICRPIIEDSPYTTEIVIPRSQSSLCLGDDTTYFLYQIHTSQSFLFIPTLASAIYLLVLRFFAREYTNVIKLLDSVNSDIPFSSLESVIFNLLSPVHNTDLHIPDALACMLRISLMTLSASKQQPWSLARALPLYSGLGYHNFASTICKVPIQDELSLLRMLLSDDIIEEALTYAARPFMHIGVSILSTYNRYSYLTSLIYSLPSFKVITPPNSSHQPSFHTTTLPPVEELIKWYTVAMSSINNLRDVPGYTLNQPSLPAGVGASQTTTGGNITIASRGTNGIEDVEQTIPLHVRLGLPKKTRFRCDATQCAQKFQFIGTLTPQSAHHIIIRAASDSALSQSGWGFILAYMLLTGETVFKINNLDCSAQFGATLTMLFRDHSKNSPFNYILRLLIEKPELVPIFPKFTAFRSLTFIRSNHREPTKIEIGLFLLMVTRTIARLFIMNPDLVRLANSLPPLGSKNPHPKAPFYSPPTQTVPMIFPHKLKGMNIIFPSNASASSNNKDEPNSSQNLHSMISQFSSLQKMMQHQFDSPKLTDADCNLRISLDYHALTGIKQTSSQSQEVVKSQLQTVIQSLLDQEQVELQANLCQPTQLYHLQHQPISTIDIQQFIVDVTRSEKNLPPLSDILPFNLGPHPAAQTTVATLMKDRLEKDIQVYAGQCNSAIDSLFTPLSNAAEIKTLLKNPTGPKMFKSVTLLSQLQDSLIILRESDTIFISLGQQIINILVNNVSLPPQYNKIVESLFPIQHTCFSTERMTLGPNADDTTNDYSNDDAECLSRLYYLLSKVAAKSSEIDFDYVIGSFISSRAKYDLLKINPYIPDEYITLVYSLVEFILLRTNRIAHINRTLFEVSDLQTILHRIRTRPVVESDFNISVTELLQKSQSLIRSLSAKRHYYTKMSKDHYDEMKLTLQHDDKIQKVWNARLKQNASKSQVHVDNSLKEQSNRVSTSPLLAASAYHLHNPLIMEHVSRTVEAAILARDAQIYRESIGKTKKLGPNNIDQAAASSTTVKNINLVKNGSEKVNRHILKSLLVDPLSPIQQHPLKASCLLRDRLGFLLKSSQQRAKQTIKQRWARLQAGQVSNENVDNPLYDVLYNTPEFVAHSYSEAKRGRYGLSLYARSGMTTSMLNTIPSANLDGDNIDEQVYIFDPRYLLFEFNFSILLRKSQVTMINDFVDAIQNGRSIVNQLLMGAGKTTIIAPLLCILLSTSKENSFAQFLAKSQKFAQKDTTGASVAPTAADVTSGEKFAGMDKLIVSVVPPALLEFSRSVMRSTFSSVIKKVVVTFTFDRQTPATYELLQKLQLAAAQRSVVIATPTSLKSVMLKFLELQYNISKPELQSRDEGTMNELHILSQILSLFKRSILLIDEIDQVLHTLKSEINFPIAERVELDFSPLRWEIAMHCLDAILHCDSGVVPHKFTHSKRAHTILSNLRNAINYGYRKNYLQSIPHLVLLNEDFYLQHLRVHIIDWMILFLDGHHLGAITHTQLKKYFDSSTLELSIEEHADDDIISARAIDPSVIELVSTINALPSHQIKLLNLARDWIRSFLPHIVTKISRVHFGLLSPQDLVIALSNDPFMPATRQKLVVPFSGRDQPAQSEFACSEVIIGLTYVSYLREGLRYSDFVEIVDMMRNNLLKELGAFSKRPTAVLYNEWVESAGGIVLGTKQTLPGGSGDVVDGQDSGQLLSSILFDVEANSVTPPLNVSKSLDTDNINQTNNNDDDDEKTGSIDIEVVSLRLLKRTNHQQMDLLFKLWQKHSPVIQWYLDTLVFPQHLRHQNIKLSASGVDLGSDLLFSRRIGFSGTPSDLLPTSLQCQYEPGADGQIISTLTNPYVASVTEMGPGWTVKSLLNFVAKSRTLSGEIKYHVLIDTGALITGISNVDVAKHLLENGLGDHIDGVVYLDKEDRKMVLLKANFRSVPLEQCGVPTSRRFCFYDQTHTVGIDVGHRLNANALVTLGKDMVFRDFAQGSYRLRNIGNGQTLELLLIPEMKSLIERRLAPVEQDKVIIEDGIETTHCDVLLKPLEKILEHQAASLAAPLDPYYCEQYRQLTRINAFLVLNSFLTERVQFVQLCTQNCTNVWKKDVFEQLLAKGVGYYTFSRFPEKEDTIKKQLLREKQQQNVVKSKFLTSIAPLENRDRKRYRLLVEEFKKIQKNNKRFERRKNDKLRLNRFFQHSMAVYNVHLTTQIENLKNYRNPKTSVRDVMRDLRTFLQQERKKFIQDELSRRKLLQSMEELNKPKVKSTNEDEDDQEEEDDDSDNEDDVFSMSPHLPLLSAYSIGFSFEPEDKKFAINSDRKRAANANLSSLLDQIDESADNAEDTTQFGEFVQQHQQRVKDGVSFKTSFVTDHDDRFSGQHDHDNERDLDFEQYLQCFIEDISAPIPDTVPKFIPFSKALEQRIQDNSHFLRGGETATLCHNILGLLKSTAHRVEDYHLNSEMVQEAMEEKTREMQTDQEQLIEVERVVEAVYDRSHETQSGWVFDLLSKEITNQQQLYHANEFSVMAFQPGQSSGGESVTTGATLSAKFPDQLYLSHNYFNMMKGVGHARRLKNIIMYLDLIPSLAKLSPFTTGHELSTLGAKATERLQEFMKEVDTHSHELELVIKSTILLGLCQAPSQTVLVKEHPGIPQISSLLATDIVTFNQLLSKPWAECQLTKENVNTILQLLTQRKNMYYLDNDTHSQSVLTDTTSTAVPNDFSEFNIDLSIFFPHSSTTKDDFTATIGAKDFIHQLASSAILSQGDNNRFIVLLSLAEAETIRRITHAKEEIAIHRFLANKAKSLRTSNKLNLPASYTPFSLDIMNEVPDIQVITNADTEFALRCMPYNGITLAKTAHFQKQSSALSEFDNTMLQLLRFINNDSHYTDAQIHTLVSLLDGNNISNVFNPTQSITTSTKPPLVQFFTSLLGARRRLQTQWVSTPIKTVLFTPSRFVLLKTATLSHLIKQFMALNDVSPLALYNWMDINNDTKISPGELYRTMQYICFNMWKYLYSFRTTCTTPTLANSFAKQYTTLEPDMTVIEDNFFIFPIDIMQLFMTALPITTIASTRLITGQNKKPSSAATISTTDATPLGEEPTQDSGQQSFSLGFKELCQLIKVSEDDDEEEEEAITIANTTTTESKTPTSPSPLTSLASPTPSEAIPLVEFDAPFPHDVFAQLLANVSIITSSATAAAPQVAPQEQDGQEEVPVPSATAEKIPEPTSEQTQDANIEDDQEEDKKEDELEQDEDAEPPAEDEDAETPTDDAEVSETNQISNDDNANNDIGENPATKSTEIAVQSQSKKAAKKGKKGKIIEDPWDKPTYSFLSQKVIENSLEPVQFIPDQDVILYNFTTPTLPPGCKILGDAKFVHCPEAPEESYWEISQYSGIVITPLQEMPSPFRTMRVSNISIELAALAPEAAENKLMQYNPQALVSGDARAMYQLENCRERLVDAIYCHEMSIDPTFWIDPTLPFLHVTESKLNSYLEYNPLLQPITPTLSTPTQPSEWPLELTRTIVHYHSLTKEQEELQANKTKLRLACGREVLNHPKLVERIHKELDNFRFLFGLYSPSSTSILGSGSSSDLILTSRGIQLSTSLDYTSASYFQDETKFNVVSMTSVYHQNSNYGETKISLGLAKLLHYSQTHNLNHSQFIVGGTGEVTLCQGKVRLRKIAFHQNPDLPLDITAKQLYHFKSFVRSKIAEDSTETTSSEVDAPRRGR